MNATTAILSTLASLNIECNGPVSAESVIYFSKADTYFELSPWFDTRTDDARREFARLVASGAIKKVGYTASGVESFVAA
jgi:hypothetical protein